MIRRAKILEIPNILNISNACAAHMQEAGIYQWNESYPSREVFEADILRNELFALIVEGSLVGFMALTTKMDPEYREVGWLTSNEHNLYVHRLAIKPAYQGKGLARKLMDFGEDHARKREMVSVRLDTFSQNKRNQRFYETRGYQRLGDIFLPQQSKHPFHCYELVL